MKTLPVSVSDEEINEVVISYDQYWSAVWTNQPST